MTHPLIKINDRVDEARRRIPFVAAREHALYPDIIEPEFWELAEMVWDFTMLPTSALYQHYGALRYAFANGIPGDIVECGVFFGGSVMLAGATALRHDPDKQRRIYALDTFKGFVSWSEKDVNYKGEPVCLPNPDHWDFTWLSTNNMRSTGFDADRLIVVKGDVLETLPTLEPRPISVLRLDTDSYETTKAELEHLHPRVSRGGVVIIDDYGYCKGCADAVNEFISGKPIFPMRQDKHGRSWVKLD